MKRSLERGNDYARAWLDLFACLAGFGAAAWVAWAWLGPAAFVATWVFSWVFSAAIAWLAIVFEESSSRDALRRWVDGFFTATGANLLVQYGLAYVFGVPAAPWTVIVLGSGLSLAAASLLREAVPAARGGRREGLLLVGVDSSTASLAAAMGEKPLGAIGSGPAFPGGELALPGGPDRLEEVCESERPRTVVVSGRPAGIRLAQLLRLHYAGIEVEGAPFQSESVLRRVAWQQLSPSDLLFSVTPVTGRAMLALQAIYKNLLGLGLLVVSAPVLILISVLTAMAAGWPAMEHIECAGLQRIPFRMFRFRTALPEGKRFWMGALVERLHLVNLPQLINVVRGEMALFGPRPVRSEFAERLCEAMPAYVYRFTVKPGILGWSQCHLEETGGVPDEALRLEYDFYYIRQESPSLDLDILQRKLFGRRVTRRPAAAPGAADEA
jgi:lipopolysaccharide/colanic/teichoic acid biosynthesis glycosyltransferase